MVSVSFPNCSILYSGVDFLLLAGQKISDTDIVSLVSDLSIGGAKNTLTVYPEEG